MASKLNQPLLAAQKQDGEQKTAPAPAPKPAPKKAKKGYYQCYGCCICCGRYELTFAKAMARAFGLSVCLITATYVAVTLHCWGPFWPKFLLSCTIDPGNYQTLNGSGHPEW